MKLTHLNPDTLHHNPAFSQVVTVEGGRLVFVGGQNSVDRNGQIIGEDLHAQTVQTLHNLQFALAAAGANQENVIKLSIYILQGQDPGAAFAAAQQVWGQHPCAVTVLIVAGLANPRFLVEIEAMAAVPIG